MVSRAKSDLTELPKTVSLELFAVEDLGEDNADLHNTIGTGDFKMTMSAKFSCVGGIVQTSDVEVKGSMWDLYDWNFDSNKESDLDPVFRSLASIQAGFGTLGTSGSVFEIKVDLVVRDDPFRGTPPEQCFGSMLLLKRIEIDAERYGGEAWLMGADGSALRKISSGDSDVFGAALSPDGKRLITFRGTDLRYCIETVGANDIACQPLDNHTVYGALWSPTGFYIGTNVDCCRGGFSFNDVCVATNFLASPQCVGATAATGGIIQLYGWYPGKDLLQVDVDSNVDVGPSGPPSRGLYLLDPVSSLWTRVLQNWPQSYYNWFSFSPDGKSVAIIKAGQTEDSKYSYSDLFLVDPLGSTQVHLTIGSEYTFSDEGPVLWSPDNAEIAFCRLSSVDGHAASKIAYKVSVKTLQVTRIFPEGIQGCIVQWQ